jgi:hypothetical protein
MRATELTVYRCGVCGNAYEQKGLADQCCSDELSRCAWDGCTEPRDKKGHSVYCPAHKEEHLENRRLEKLMAATPVDSWSDEEDAVPLCYDGEHWYGDLESLIDDLSEDEEWDPSTLPEWEYCVKPLTPDLDLFALFEERVELFEDDFDDLDNVTPFPVPDDILQELDAAQERLLAHWRLCTGSTYVVDRSRRWPLRKLVLEAVGGG